MTGLTDAVLRKLAREKKPGKFSDGDGLFLRVTKTGALLWQMKYRSPENGKENTASFGAYPEVKLAEAREKRAEARSLLRKGVDPNRAKRASIEQRDSAESNTFRAVAAEWFGVHKTKVAQAHSTRLWRRLELYVFPFVGNEQCDCISPLRMLDVLRRIEASGKHETAHRVATICSQIFRHAVVTGRSDKDPCSAIKSALIAIPPAQHMAAITDPDKLGEFLWRANGYSGRSGAVQAALRLLPMVLLRPGELRLADWSEISWETAEWVVPAARMKQRMAQKRTGEPHIVPLPKQAMAILRELQHVTGPTGYIFKGTRGPKRAISDNTLNAALRGLGYSTSEEVTAHGFRATARTLAVERLGIKEAVVEAQLAHSVKDQLGRAYNRAQFLDERRTFLQSWADYLDLLRDRRRSVQPVLTQYPYTGGATPGVSPVLPGETSF